MFENYCCSGAGARIGSVSGHRSSSPESDVVFTVSWSSEDTTPAVAVSPQGVLFLATLLDADRHPEVVVTVTAVVKNAPELATTARVKIVVSAKNGDFVLGTSIKYKNKCLTYMLDVNLSSAC